MGLHEGRAQLTKGMKLLLNQWTETHSAWADVQSKQFEARFILPLEQDLRKALLAMDHMAAVLHQIRIDCEE